MVRCNKLCIATFSLEKPVDTTMTDFYAKFAESNQQAMQSALKFNEIAARAQGLVMRHQMAALESCMEAGTKMTANSSSDPADALAKGSELGVKLGEQFSTLMRESLEIQAEVNGEFTKWAEDGWKAMSSVAPIAPQPAKARAKA